jgi:hypothetical protein
MPPWPELADPDPIFIEPLLPELEEPLLNTTCPLTPDWPEFDVINTREPLDDAVP